MSERLIIRDLGPLINIEIDIKPFLIIIGPQSTGKSIISKIFSIVKNTYFLSGKSSFLDLAEGFLINNFLNENSYIHFTSPFYTFEFKNLKESLTFEFAQGFKDYHDYLDNKEWSNEARDEIANKLKEIHEQIDSYKNDSTQDIDFKMISEELSKLTIRIEKREKYSKTENEEVQLVRKITNYSYYIPAERSLIPIVLDSILSFTESKINLPLPLLTFGTNYESARKKIGSFDIPLLNEYTYNFKNGADFISIKNNSKDIRLIEGSSGIQSMVPLLIVLRYLTDVVTTAQSQSTFIIEEPELNIYPEMQYALLKHIVGSYKLKDNSKTNLVITTHSPYILSSINNLLLAHKVKQSKNQTLDFVSINPDEFNAYFIKNGINKSIFDSENGLIAESELDIASNVILNDFEVLLKALTEDEG